MKARHPGKIVDHAVRQGGDFFKMVVVARIAHGIDAHACLPRPPHALQRILEHDALPGDDAQLFCRQHEQRAVALARVPHLGGGAHGVEQLPRAKAAQGRPEQRLPVGRGHGQLHPSALQRPQVIQRPRLQRHPVGIGLGGHAHPTVHDFLRRPGKAEAPRGVFRGLPKAHALDRAGVVLRFRDADLLKEGPVHLPPDPNAVQQRAIQVEYGGGEGNGFV